MAERGKFIVLEGQGFTGKTEQSALLVARLQRQGIDVIESREPGGVPAAELVREELLRRRASKTITPIQEMELFYRSRGIFLGELVQPSLRAGRWVVSSRFSASTLVYQGKEGGIDLSLIYQHEERVVGEDQPDLYYILDVEPEEIFRRMWACDNGRQIHAYNEMDFGIVANRQRYYLELLQERPSLHWAVIDGNGSVEKVHQRIWQVAAERFNL